jgi:hypothetical protein
MILGAAVLGLLAMLTPARADWDLSDPAKWVQMPDVGTGLNVDAQRPHILADDFPCNKTGPITDIHVWGSWFYEQFDPDAVFRLGIWSDNPVGPDPGDPDPNPYSAPRDLLWEHDFAPGDYVVRPWALSFEWFMDPEFGPVGFDVQVWQYNFLIDPTYAFTQQQGNVYWLSVQASPNLIGVPYGFGWKTSLDHWNDFAVWGVKDAPGPGPTAPWQPLVDFTGRSLDLAFAITTVPDGGASAWWLGIGVLALGLGRRHLRK